jgi:hypothetical protein
MAVYVSMLEKNFVTAAADELQTSLATWSSNRRGKLSLTPVAP